MYRIDDRKDYSEIRFGALGFLDARLHLLVFTEVAPNIIRAISLRKATPQERNEYAEE